MKKHKISISTKFSVSSIIIIIAVVAIAGIIYTLRDPITTFIQNTFESTATKEIKDMDEG